MRFDTMPWDKDYDAEAHRAECQRVYATNKLKGQMANDAGHLMEKQIETAAEEYLLNGIAKVIKVPEPFRVVKKYRNGKAQIYFQEHAEPDFIGSIYPSGRCIVFEAKYTDTTRIHLKAVTENQQRALDTHTALGAITAVCCGIQGRYYFVPWKIFRDMKRILGHYSASQQELEPFEVKFTGNAIMFLHYKRPKEHRLEFMRKYSIADADEDMNKKRSRPNDRKQNKEKNAGAEHLQLERRRGQDHHGRKPCRYPCHGLWQESAGDRQ